MSTIDDDRTTLGAMRAALNKRRDVTPEGAERQALADEVDRISDALLDLASLEARERAGLIVAAAANVSRLLSSARPNPFDGDLRPGPRPPARAAGQPPRQGGNRSEAAAPAARDTDATPGPVQPGPAAAARPAPGPAVPGELPPFVRGNTLAALSEDYTLCWAACRITPEKRAAVEEAADRLMKGQARYQAVSARTNGVPWQLIGIMHGLECGYDFSKHLHNGDGLGAPTHREPPGRPPRWDPSRQTWEDSAVDAVELKDMHKVGTWSLPAVLYALEGFNGFGYRPLDVRSPYLWSFSNLYTKGKFVRDHVFDADAVSAQVGSALVLKVLEERGAGLGVLERPPAASQPDARTAELVRQACEACFDKNKNDCNRFVKAVAAKFGVSISGNANDIVDALRNDGVWTPLPDGVAAARSAAAGNLVIAGLKGSEQADPSVHGHVVVVVEGRVERGAYPTAYWGSLGGNFAKDKTVNFAWASPDRDRVFYAERPIP